MLKAQAVEKYAHSRIHPAEKFENRLPGPTNLPAISSQHSETVTADREQPKVYARGEAERHNKKWRGLRQQRSARKSARPDQFLAGKIKPGERQRFRTADPRSTPKLKQPQSGCTQKNACEGSRDSSDRLTGSLAQNARDFGSRLPLVFASLRSFTPAKRLNLPVPTNWFSDHLSGIAM